MADYTPQKPKTLAELKKLVKPLRNINIERKQNLSTLDKLALWITNHVGTMGSESYSSGR
jgi:hypothetical protein